MMGVIDIFPRNLKYHPSINLLSTRIYETYKYNMGKICFPSFFKQFSRRFNLIKMQDIILYSCLLNN